MEKLKKPIDETLTLEAFWDKYSKMDLLLQKWNNNLNQKFRIIIDDGNNTEKVVKLINETREIISNNNFIFNNE